MSRVPERTAIAGLAVLLLQACATAAPTPYQPAVDGFGYSEQQLEANRWRVTFAGNTATPRRTVDNYLLYRAAELTLRNDYDWFTVAHRRSDLGGNSTVAAPSVGIGFGGGSGFGFGYSTAIGGSTTGGRYTPSVEILMGQGKEPENDLNTYDALDLANQLEPEIRRPTGG